MYNLEPPTLNDGDRVVVRTGDVKLTTGIRTVDHSLIADEPLEIGGRNEGPTAYDLLLAALGSYTSITLQMYASRKGWDVGEITVRLRHEEVRAKNYEGSDKTSGRIDRFECKIEFTGDLTDQQLERLLYIADRYPVHRTLIGPVVISTTPGQPSESSSNRDS